MAFNGEADGDIHLVVASPLHRSQTMIVEFPQASCLGGAAPTMRRRISAARTALVRGCGRANERRFKTLHGTATIEGVGFFDIIHGQRGVAPSGIELHPALRFSAQSRCRSG